LLLSAADLSPIATIVKFAAEAAAVASSMVEAVACDENGVASFDLVRHHRANDSVFLYAFDLIELNGDDLRRDPLEVRKATLASVSHAAPLQHGRRALR
jgi:bifunctional non-homologous end joining protein LigD